MTHLTYERRGAGDPLVLVHGLGSSRRVWDPITSRLAERFEVVAVDLPGFGGSEPLPRDVEPVPATLAASLAALLDELGVTAPHVVGNSLGGWVGLELARVRPVSSLTLLSPAGLWADRTPTYTRVSLRASHWLARHAGGLLSWLMSYRLGRVLVLGQTHGRPGRLTPDEARRALHAMGTGPGFDATLRATVGRHHQAGPADVGVPVTVAFGSRDLVLLPWQSRHVDQLPEGTRVVPLPGCGHVPTFDDPEAVVAVITRAAARPRLGPPAGEDAVPETGRVA
jgi:pimeloyl-ACP methyl ester carboxylesterase